MRFLARWTVILACFCVISCSKSQKEQEDQAAVAAFGSRKEMNDRLEKIISESNRVTRPATATLPNGEKVPTRERIPPSVPLPSKAEDPVLLAQVSDIIGDQWTALEKEPASLAVANDGSLIYGGMGKTWLRKSASEDAKEILPYEVDTLTFNAHGDSLLAQHKADVVILFGADFADHQTIDPHPPGRAIWGETEGTLLFVDEKINFSAEEKYRILLQPVVYEIASKKQSPLSWSPERRYSAIGTLPAAGMTWGHLLKHYKIDAMPAPMYLLDKGTPIASLTQTDKAADILPSADANQNLFWIRTYRRGGNSGRAFFRSGENNQAPPIQLTGRPTSQIAVSNTGEFCACAIRDDEGHYQLRRFATAELKSNFALCAMYASADSDLRERVSHVVDSLRDVFLREKPGDGAKATPFGEALNAPPKPDQIDRMGDALEASLRTEFGVELDKGPEGLRQLDAVFDQIGSYISEEPPIVLGLASLEARRLGPDAKWILDDSSTSLSADYTDYVNTDDMSYTAVSLFAIARERISGTLSLYTTIQDINQQNVKPVYLVESFRQPVLQAIMQSEIGRAGSAALGAPAAKRLEIFKQVTTNNSTLDLLLIDQAKKEKNDALALLAATRLAENTPGIAKPLDLLATRLYDAFYTDEALQFFERALLLNPADTDVRFSYADCLASMNRLDDAKKEYDLIKALDVGNVLAEDLASRMETLDSLRKGSGK